MRSEAEILDAIDERLIECRDYEAMAARADDVSLRQARLLGAIADSALDEAIVLAWVIGLEEEWVFERLSRLRQDDYS